MEICTDCAHAAIWNYIAGKGKRKGKGERER